MLAMRAMIAFTDEGCRFDPQAEKKRGKPQIPIIVISLSLAFLTTIHRRY
jgi:hypothetical protein